MCEKEDEHNQQNLWHKTRQDLDWCGDGLYGSLIFQQIKVNSGHTCRSTTHLKTFQNDFYARNPSLSA